MKQFVTSECVYLSANRFSMAWENGIQMPFTFFVFAWHWKTDFVFRFRFTLKNGYEFQFSFFVFASLWKTDMNFVFALLWKTDLNFVFRFRITLKNGFEFRFSFLYGLLWTYDVVVSWKKNDCKTWFVILCYLAFCDFKFYSLQIFVIFLFHRAYTSVAIAAPKSTCFFRGYHHIICNPLLKRSTVCGGHIMGAGEFTTHFGPGEEKIQLLSFA